MRLKDEQKLTAIIDATLTLTHEKGLAGIKMSELAKRAGIATGSLYTYFEDKTDLLLSVNRAVRQQGAGYLREHFDPEGDFRTRFNSYVGSYADYVSANRSAILFADLLKRSPFMTDEAKTETIEQYRFLIELTSEGIEAGEVRDNDPEELLHVMDSLVKAVIDFRQIKGEAYTEQTRAKCLEYVWAAISA